MTNLNDFHVTDGVTDVLAAQYNRVIDSIVRGELSNTESLTGAKTLIDADYPLQVFTPTAARDVTLPAVGVANHPFWIVNASGTYALTVKNAGGSIITTITPSMACQVVSNGTTWSAMVQVPAAGTAGNALISDGSAWYSGIPYTGAVCNGRLTLETGVPISTSDQANKTTLYFTPFNGNRISLYDGSKWIMRTFSELSLNISGFSASKPYDIWAYDNSGTVALDSTVWTDGTTRATALTTQDGVYVKTGATTRRYLGTIYMDASSKCQDTATKRYVWNLHNQVYRKLLVKEATASWTYTTATWRSANNSTANRVEVICGLAGAGPYSLRLVYTTDQSASGNSRTGGIGLNVTNANSADISTPATAAQTAPQLSVLSGTAAVGYTYFQWVEFSVAAGTTTWYGSDKSGLTGEVLG